METDIQRHIEKERCTKTERYIGTDARRHSWKHGFRDPYKCSSVEQRELAETDIDKDTDRQTFREVHRQTEVIEPVAQRHQMVSGSLALLNLCLH